MPIKFVITQNDSIAKSVPNLFVITQNDSIAKSVPNLFVITQIKALQSSGQKVSGQKLSAYIDKRLQTGHIIDVGWFDTQYFFSFPEDI